MPLFVSSRHLLPLAALQFTSNFLSCVVGKCFLLLLLRSASALLPPHPPPPPPLFHRICLPLSCYTTVICIHTGRRSHEGKTVLVFISGPYKSPLTPTPALVLSDFKWRRLTGSPLAFRGMSSLQPCDRLFSPPSPHFPFAMMVPFTICGELLFSDFLGLFATNPPTPRH